MTITYTINDNSFEFEPEELKNFTNTIIREDGFENDEQVLREKTDTSLTFYSDAYCYLCALKRQSPCANIDFKLYINGELLFNGTFQLSDIEFNLTKKSAKTGAIKDATFVGVIDEVIDVEIKAYYSKTKNCEPLERNTLSLEVYPNTDLSNPKNILAFDVLDLFKQIVSYFSDNTVNVVSDYLTNNKIAITLGYNLDGTAGSLEQTYPSISFKQLFDEVRKKYRIYMEVSANEIVIEQEDYFFEDTEVLRFDDLPFDAVEKFDIKRMFNEIKVGSSDTEAETVNYPQVYQKAWNEENYTSCGNCLVQKDSEQSTLDLVSDFIIDSNVIYEAVNGVDGNNSNIFMIEYYIDGSIAKAKMTDDGSGVYYYNDGFRNINVINNWLGYSPQCIAYNREPFYGFKTYEQGYIEVSSGSFGAGIVFTSDRNNIIRYEIPNDVLFDKESSLFNNDIYVDPHTYFFCQNVGVYEFKASGIVRQIAGTDVIGADLILTIEAWTDSTLTSMIDSVSYVVNNSPNLNNTDIPMELTGSFSLNAGNVVVVRYRMIYSNIGFKEWVVSVRQSTFELINDNYSCDDIGENTSSRPYLLKFERELCRSDFEKLKQNKRGYILINGIKYWIGKSIEWNIKGFAEFELIGEDTQC